MLKRFQKDGPWTMKHFNKNHVLKPPLFIKVLKYTSYREYSLSNSLIGILNWSGDENIIYEYRPIQERHFDHMDHNDFDKLNLNMDHNISQAPK